MSHYPNTVHPVVIQQPGHYDGHPVWRKWQSGLCGCCEDISGCLFCTFCHPCFLCSLASRMDECFCGPFCCGATFIAAMRAKMRGDYKIKGTICDDVMCSICCNMCVAHQMHREWKSVRPN